MLVIIIPVICGVVTAFCALVTWWYLRGDRQVTAANSKIDARIQLTYQPISERIHSLEILHDHDHQERERELMRAVIAEAIKPTEQTLTTIGVKVETLWENLAGYMAQILHQPDPRRAHIDRLLEAFMDGTLTIDERTELKKHLNVIRKWEPGQDSPYPIHPGEPVAAAILLLTMEDPHTRTKQ